VTKKGVSRERISINDNWRFIKGDPMNVNSQDLLCNVRPVSRNCKWAFAQILF
jgi:hypothetical protein